MESKWTLQRKKLAYPNYKWTGYDKCGQLLTKCPWIFYVTHVSWNHWIEKLKYNKFTPHQDLNLKNI